MWPGLVLVNVKCDLLCGDMRHGARVMTRGIIPSFSSESRVNIRTIKQNHQRNKTKYFRYRNTSAFHELHAEPKMIDLQYNIKLT